MNYFRTILLSCFLPVIFFGCAEDIAENSTKAYLTGEIVNPISAYVVLLKNNKAMDTLYLNQANRFKAEFKNIDAGLYTIKHGINSQVVHIAAGDSILLRVNTLEFDESLHYSGSGAEKNNFLINLFLKDEANKALIFSYYNFPPREFAKKTDSIKAARLNALKTANEKYQFGSNFMEMAKKSIFYEIYDLRERYTYMVNTYYDEFEAEIPAHFHAYRKKVNFNEKILQANPGYIRFIEDYLINKTIANCHKKEPKGNECNINSTENILQRVKLANKLIQLPSLRKHLFWKLGAKAMTMAKNWKETRTILKVLKEKGMNEVGLEKLKRLALIQTAFMPGIMPRDVPFVDSSGKKVVVQDIVNQPTIFYVWSMNSPSRHEQEHKIIKNYAIKYPEINFIGVNVDLDETKKWMNTLKKYGYEPEKEFQLGAIDIDGKSIKKELYKYYLNKMVFLNAEGKIIIGNANLRSPAFESRILEFLNQ